MRNITNGEGCILSGRPARVIDRYTRPEMGAVWSDRRKIDAWLAVEIAVCEAWRRRGRIPDWAIEKIRADMERDFFIDPEEAKAYGLIDQVLNKRAGPAVAG